MQTREQISCWGWFRCPNLERRFLRHHLSFDKVQAALAFSVAIISSLAFIPSDYRLLKSSGSFHVLLFYRIIFAFGTSLMLLLLRRIKQPKTLERLMLAWTLTAMMLMLHVATTRVSVFYFGYVVTEIVGLFLVFMVVPLTLPVQIAIGAMAAVIETFILIPRQLQVDPLVSNTVVVAYLLTLMIGGSVSCTLRRTRREQFAALEREAAMRNSLETAMAEVRTLRGILPICSYCKNVRDDAGYWQQVEVYVTDNTEAEFSHGICPDCIGKF